MCVVFDRLTADRLLADDARQRQRVGERERGWGEK